MTTAISEKSNLSQAGFSLMEAIVAVAILGAASVPILILQSQTARSVIRLESSATRISAERVAADYLSVVEFSGQAPRELEMGGGWNLAWSVVPVSQPTKAVIGVGVEGRYDTVLVRISAVVRHLDGQEFDVDAYRLVTNESFPYRTF